MQFLNGDQYRLFILLIIYIIQGIPVGFLLGTMRIILKKHYSYTDVGILTFSSIPFKIKFLMAPVVDSVYWSSLGKRRTWIIPTQLLAAIFFVTMDIDMIVTNYSVYVVTFAFGVIFLCLALQDIAADAWAVTIVKEESLGYSCTAQNVGLSMGSFISTTVYLAFNSTSFCNSYIRPWYVEPELLSLEEGLYSQPILNETNFMYGWGIFTLLASLYILAFHNEKDDRVKSENKQTLSVYETFKLAIKLIVNKNMLYLIFFWVVTKLFLEFSNASNLYLLEEKRYDQAKYSMISGISFPVRIITFALVTKKVYDNPFKAGYFILFAKVIIDLLSVNLLLWNYDAIQEYDSRIFDISLVLVTISEAIIFAVTFSATGATYNKMCTPLYAGTHITIFTSISNLSRMVPVLYSYKLIDAYGLFYPTLLGSLATLVILLLVKPIVGILEKTKREDFDVEEKVENKEKEE
ncbi:unnamed protein product [Moneuplotes crassus]|uniref:Uncharacterized protein n=1 Tax=Euplotes crassus TaxID=5936 RepID=A0AAD1UJF1_EUPCR|nr:unnamed protein product [Moneuplotes crassus]